MTDSNDPIRHSSQAGLASFRHAGSQAPIKDYSSRVEQERQGLEGHSLHDLMVIASDGDADPATRDAAAAEIGSRPVPKLDGSAIGSMDLGTFPES
jgi:hypothetical protein